VQQRIVETENHINVLVGRFPQPVQCDAGLFNAGFPDAMRTGVPARLLSLRPDVRRAELELEAARLDVKAARASFYPALRITAGAGLNAFNGAYFMETPASLIYNAAGDLVAPLINRNAIKAAYASANARQQLAVYEYERTLLNVYVEVVNQLSGIDNLTQSYSLRQQQVDALSSSITTSNNLFRSARADYMEVLMTQRDALGSKVELVELRRQQLGAQVAMYQALGGGWR
jgi:outer membrane protein TolC